MWIFWVFIVLAVGAKILLPDKTVLPRVGIDPRPFNIKLWPARIYFMLQGRSSVDQGYRKVFPFQKTSQKLTFPAQFKDVNFLTQTLVLERLVVAPKFLAELRLLPESKLSATAALVDKVLGIYNGVDIILQDHQSSNICRVQLTKNLRIDFHSSLSLPN